MRDWLLRTCQVHSSRLGLTDLLYRMSFAHKLTTSVPCQADAAAQADFLDELVVLEAQAELGEALLYHADAAHPTHQARCPRAWCAVN